MPTLNLTGDWEKVKGLIVHSNRCASHSCSTFVDGDMDGLYREVARVLKRLEGKQGSLKSLVFASERTCSRKKKLYALASQTIKCE